MTIRAWRFLPLILIVGCGEPDVRTYKVPSPHVVPGFEPETATEFRIVGAMFPAENPTWFFKAVGSAKVIDKFEPEFDAFLKTVTFPEGTTKAPQWVKPDGVTVGPPKEFRFATLIFTIDGKAVELTVAEAKGGLQANLDRWIGQVNSKKTDPAEVTKPIALGMVQGLKVSLIGPKNPSDSRAMMAPR